MIKKVSSTLMIFLLLIVIVIGGSIAYSYYTTDETSVPSVAIMANSKSVRPQSYDWNTSLLNGLLYRDFNKDNINSQYDIGTINFNHLDISAPDGYTLDITIHNEDYKTIFNGDEKAYKDLMLKENGSYTFKVIATHTQLSDKDSYGQFTYSIRLQLEVSPFLITSSTKVTQGDVLAIEVKNVPEGVIPTAETDLGMSVFTNINGRFLAFVPVGYVKQAGTHSVLISCGNFKEEITVEVVEGVFEKQYLTVDTSNPVITEASSSQAYSQFRNTIYPFYETADSETYWSGKFLQPVEGRISTEYGLMRYTNGSKKASRHSGIDIAAATGTEIVAPAAGRVVYADRLLNTGNTLVIEHGGGLKSYFFHMNNLNVKKGDMVKKSQSVGEVGSTGYSTGPHLHFEFRIGNQSINPWNLFNGTGGLFSLLDK